MSEPVDAFWGGSLDGQAFPLNPAYHDRSTVSDSATGDVYTRNPSLDDGDHRAWVYQEAQQVTAKNEISIEPAAGSKWITLAELASLVHQARLAGHPETAPVFARVTWSGLVQVAGVKPVE